VSSATIELQRLPRTGKVTEAHVIVSEWTKLRSLRSTQWSFLVAAILTIGFPALFAVVTSSHWGTMNAHQRANRTPIDFAVGGINLSQLAIGVLGVLVISGEYSTGMIRSSLAAVPKRLPVLWAKIVVFAGATLAVILPSVIAAFYITQAILSKHDILQTSFTAPGIARCVVGGALFVTVLGIFALALGAITRNTAAGIATFVGIMFVIPPIFDLLPSSWNNAISPWLPSNAGRDIFSLTTGAHDLHPWPGFLLFCGYTAMTVAVAAVLLRRRDA
jgi:ABC-type transport system involved in multi-copper enzyme maturation permease subunit